jgi:hypothetical protein
MPDPSTFTDVALRRPARLWMTGSLALIMASVGSGRLPPAEERGSPALRLSRHSPYGVTETVQRIEAAAREHGQAVLFRLDGAQPVIVFASSLGGTPAAMSESGMPPQMLLRLHVRAGADGGAEVEMPAWPSALAHAQTELPARVLAEVEALPDLLDRALA